MLLQRNRAVSDRPSLIRNKEREDLPKQDIERSKEASLICGTHG